MYPRSVKTNWFIHFRTQKIPESSKAGYSLVSVSAHWDFQAMWCSNMFTWTSELKGSLGLTTFFFYDSVMWGWRRFNLALVCLGPQSSVEVPFCTYLKLLLGWRRGLWQQEVAESVAIASSIKPAAVSHSSKLILTAWRFSTLYAGLRWLNQLASVCPIVQLSNLPGVQSVTPWIPWWCSCGQQERISDQISELNVHKVVDVSVRRCTCTQCHNLCTYTRNIQMIKMQ